MSKPKVRPGPASLSFGNKEIITEEKKSQQGKQNNPLPSPPLAQGLDPPLMLNRECFPLTAPWKSHQ